MTPFEYVVGIHTIVLGLGTAYLLTTITDTIKYRKSITQYWVHTAWSVVLQFLLIGWWYGLWRTIGDEAVISYGGFLREFAFTLALFMAVRFLILDVDRSQGVDLKAHFNEIRIPFFICLGFPYAWAVFIGMWTSEETGTPVGDLVTVVIQLAIPIAGALVANERAQAAFVLIYGVTYLVIEFQQYGVGYG